MISPFRVGLGQRIARRTSAQTQEVAAPRGLRFKGVQGSGLTGASDVLLLSLRS